MKQTIGLEGVSFNDLWAYCTARARKNPEYETALPHVAPAFFAAKRHNLRFNRKSHVLRDNRLGELSRPSNPSEWPDFADLDETIETLCRSVWCDAVRNRNLAA